ncbi:UPF0149 family protein [Aidingimonas lacisalsi]|uniref:UPF0149 family protein n=1 Tax=Aidingimonas lacisalsi TaxID=2604086 RepID=UPI0011D1EFDF|nr:UPF0149 family protein [Aidingimonas lacisalsi]
MSLINEHLDFSTIADLFLLHGSLQSPAFLDGRLAAGLGLHDISAEAWLTEVCEALGVEQPKDPASAEGFLGWRRQALDALSAAELNYEPLLPDELFSLTEQARGLQEWSQGFLEVVNEVGVDTRNAWSANLREALDDLEAVAVMEVELDDDSENENDLFALAEHARMVAMLLYTEQHPGQPQVDQVESPSGSANEEH